MQDRTPNDVSGDAINLNKKNEEQNNKQNTQDTKDVKVEEKHTNMRLRISENKTNSTAKESTGSNLANNAIKQESSNDSNDNEEVLNLKDFKNKNRHIILKFLK